MARGKTRPPRFRFNLICPNKLLCPSWLRPCTVAPRIEREREPMSGRMLGRQRCRDSRAQIKENLCFANGDAWAASNAEVSTTLRGNGDLIPRRVCVSCCDAPDRRCRIIVPFERGDRTTLVTDVVRYCISIL